MTTPSATLSAILSRVSRDQRQTAAYYANLVARPGGPNLRLFSDYGFLADAGFDYLAPHPTLVTRSADPRAVRSVVIRPFGVAEDFRALTATAAVDRRRVLPYPANPAYVMAGGRSSDTTASADALLAVVQGMVSARRGPAWHFVVARSGDVLVGAVLDDYGTASGTASQVAIDVALESMLVEPADARARRDDSTLIEPPLTDVQHDTLRILLAKVFTAYPGIEHSFSSSQTSGLSYPWPQGLGATRPFNFTDGAWRGASPFDHTHSDSPQIFADVVGVGAFDLVTQVYRPPGEAPPVTTRAQAQTAITQADSAGALSIYLSIYPAIAAPDRAMDMANMARQQFFVERVDRANHDADQSAGSAGTVLAADAPAPAASTNVSPWVYDYGNGTWGDGQTY